MNENEVNRETERRRDCRCHVDGWADISPTLTNVVPLLTLLLYTNTQGHAYTLKVLSLLNPKHTHWHECVPLLSASHGHAFSFSTFIVITFVLLLMHTSVICTSRYQCLYFTTSNLLWSVNYINWTTTSEQSILTHIFSGIPKRGTKSRSPSRFGKPATRMPWNMVQLSISCSFHCPCFPGNILKVQCVIQFSSTSCYR